MLFTSVETYPGASSTLKICREFAKLVCKAEYQAQYRNIQNVFLEKNFVYTQTHTEHSLTQTAPGIYPGRPRCKISSGPLP